MRMKTPIFWRTAGECIEDSLAELQQDGAGNNLFSTTSDLFGKQQPHLACRTKRCPQTLEQTIRARRHCVVAHCQEIELIPVCKFLFCVGFAHLETQLPGLIHRPINPMLTFCIPESQPTTSLTGNACSRQPQILPEVLPVLAFHRRRQVFYEGRSPWHASEPFDGLMEIWYLGLDFQADARLRSRHFDGVLDDRYSRLMVQRQRAGNWGWGRDER